MNDCSQYDPMLGAAISGELATQSLAMLETHLEKCDRCRERLNRAAASEDQWNRISDIFSGDRRPDEMWSGPQTVDVKLKHEVIDEDFEVNEVMLPASHPEMLGRIDGFEIEQIIGQGGMGLVYKGFDTELNRPVAIKVLARHLAASGVARQRFAREARAAAAVIHPNVVPIHSVNSTASQPYIVMTLVDGRSIQAHVTESGQLPVREIVRISRQIAAGLTAAHREGLVHRDIKPANILMEKDVSRVMITDFGLARAADDVAMTRTGWLAGTPHYMSPEQASGSEVDQRSDLFSLGSLMYFMATGLEPFRAEIPVAVLQKITSDEPTPVRTANPEIPGTLQRLIGRLMAKRPEDRFQTATEVEDVLTRYLAHLEQPESQPRPKFRAAPKRRSRWKPLFATAAILLIAVGAFSWGATVGRNTEPTASSESPLQWPEGLQSPAKWQSELELLQRDIESLEQSSAGQSTETPDWMLIETERLGRDILRLEQLLK